MFTCELCGRTFDTKTKFGGHKAGHARFGKKYPRGGPEKKKPFTDRQCKKCGKTFFSRQMGGHVTFCGRERKPFEELSYQGKKQVLLEERNFCCWECGVSSWNGKPLVLEMDHINGNPDDNSRENLRILCPNCHSQTPTFRNRNKNKGIVSKRHEGQKRAMKISRDRRKSVTSSVVERLPD